MLSEPTANELELAVKRLVGKRCIGFTAGASAGSAVNLEFEPRRPRAKPVPNPSLTEEQRLGEAEYSVFVSCAWRLDSEQAVICGAWDDNGTDGTMQKGLGALVGKSVQSFQISSPGLDLNLEFPDGLTFRIFCDQVNEEDKADNYCIFSSQEAIVVGTKSRIGKEVYEVDSSP